MKKTKFVKGLLLGTIGFAMLGLGAACNLANDPAEFTGFLPGVAVKVKRGETIYMEEFIDYVEDSNYTIVIEKKGDSQSTDMTNKKRFPADHPGEYTITYTVLNGSNKGTYVHTFIVPADNITWMATTEPIEIWYEKDLVFEDLYAELNIYADSYYPWTPFVESIRVGDKIIDVEDDATSYYVTDLNMHYITFGIRTEDGQEKWDIVPANVIYSENQTNLYVNSKTEGVHTVEVAGATSLKINGNDVPAEDVVITDTSIAFDKQVLYNKYAGTNFVSIQTADGEVRDTINVYTDLVSMEEETAVPPAFFSPHGNNLDVIDGRMSISDKFATDGNYSLEVIAAKYYWPRMLISIEYLDMIFSDEAVTSFVFDVTYAGTSEEHTHRDFNTKHGSGTTLLRNVPNTRTMTRAQYEQLKADIAASKEAAEADPTQTPLADGWVLTLQNTRGAAGGYDCPPRLYFDNFRAIYSLEEETFCVEDNDSESNYTIMLDGVTGVTINGEAIPEDKLEITDTQVVIDKAWLYEHVGTNLIELQVGKRTYEKTLNLYSINYNFENFEIGFDGTKLGLFTFTGMNTNPTMSIVNHNNSNALQMTDQGHKWSSFDISAAYFDMVFADPFTTAVSFDLTIYFTPTTEATQIACKDSMSNEKFMLSSGETRTITMTYAQYIEWTKNEEGTYPLGYRRFAWSNQVENTGSVPLTWYIDNLRAIVSIGTVNLTHNSATGNHTIAVEGITDLKYNNAAIPQDKYEITTSGATVDKAYLASVEGSNTLTIVLGKRIVEQTVNVYSQSYAFEDEKAPAFVSMPAEVTNNQTLSIVEYNNSKALSATDDHKWSSFEISTAYLDWAFSSIFNASVSFDLTVNFTPTTANTTISLQSPVLGAEMRFESGVKQTVVLTYANYKAYRKNNPNATEVRFAWGNEAENTGSVQLIWYIDNLQVNEGTIDFNGWAKDTTDYPDFIKFANTSTTTGLEGFLETTTKVSQNVGYSTLTESDQAFTLTSGPTNNILFGFSEEFLTSVFADSNVKALTWEFWITSNGANANGTMKSDNTTMFTRTISLTKGSKVGFDGNTMSSDGNQVYTAGVKKTLTLTRENFQAWLDNKSDHGQVYFGWTAQKENTGYNLVLHFDNFTLVR